ncbi:MAG TPA: hypothetical protein VLD61_01875 [Methylomirabilota bacterium]|nr:hypothetical protein [Methylomirabilota bacterium]
MSDDLIVEMLRRRSGRGSSLGLEAETRAAIGAVAEPGLLPGIVARLRPLATMSMATIAVAAVTVFVGFVLVGLGALNRPGSPGGISSPSPDATRPAQPPSAPPGAPLTSDIPAFPPEGATLSDATPGELVLRFEPSTPWMTSWLFADGRLITWRYGSRPQGAGDEYVGLIEQRLTPAGVDLLTSGVISTGLFERDRALLWEGSGFLNIEVLNGDRLVRLGWGHRMWGGAWETAPPATPEQAQALRALTDLLSSPASWPVTAWADRTERSYVPPSYGICVRGVPDPVDPDEIWSAVPQSAQDLRDEAQPPDPSMGGTDDTCTHLTTDEARELARILVAAGLERTLPRFSGEIWLRYTIEDPYGDENDLWFSFGPVLPHGEAVWLGPG